MPARAREPNKAYRAALGVRVRRARLRGGYTQEELAHLAGISPPYLGGIERGEMNPTVEQLVRLSMVLQTQPGAFLPRLNFTTGKPVQPRSEKKSD